LVLQRRVWWARYGVPADVRDAFDGRREHWVNLKTDHLPTASARVHRYTSEFHSRVREARGKSGAVHEDALEWRKTVATAGMDADVAVDAAIREAARRYVKGGVAALVRAADMHHEGSEGDALLDLGGPQAKTFVDIAILGRTPLLPFVDAWHTVRATEVEAKTAFIDKAAVLRFVDKLPLTSDVTKVAVADWVENRKREVSPQTVQREVSGLRAFWAYLRGRGEVSKDADDPFSQLRFKDGKKNATKTKRTRFQPAEVTALFEAATVAGDQELADLIALAAYTGARREELCAVKIEDLADGWMTVHEADAKTSAGGRDIPLHPKVTPVIERLRGSRRSGYLFAGLTENQYGTRGDAVGKRFSRLKTAQGHPVTKTFHSIRHTVSHQLEAAQIPENLAADILGHKKSTITYGLYSGRGATRALLPAAVSKIEYPSPL